MRQFCIIFGLLLIQLSSLAQNAPYKIIMGPMLDTENVTQKHWDVLEALKVWKAFIQDHNDSFLITKDAADTELKKAIFDKIFNPGFPAEAVTFHVLNYDAASQGYVFENMIQFIEPAWRINYVLSYFKIGARKINGRFKLYFVTDDYLAGLQKAESKWITYYCPKGDPVAASTITVANNYCDSVAKVFGLKHGQKAGYIITEKNRVFEVFGCYYSISGYASQNVKLRGQTFILDTEHKGFYRHELVHYLFSEYRPLDILNEGIASWLASPGQETFREAIDTLKTLPYQDTTVLKKIVTHAPPYWQPVYFYAIGGIIMQHAYKTGGAKVVKELLSDHSSKDIFILLKKHFNIPKNESAEEFLVRLIRES